MKRNTLIGLAFVLALAIPMMGCQGGGQTADGADAAKSEDYSGAPPGAQTTPGSATTPAQEGTTTPSTPSAGF